MGNMCVMTLYNPLQSGTYAPDACALYRELLDTSFANARVSRDRWDGWS